MKCPKCDCELESNAKFCSKCGFCLDSYKDLKSKAKDFIIECEGNKIKAIQLLTEQNNIDHFFAVKLINEAYEWVETNDIEEDVPKIVTSSTIDKSILDEHKKEKKHKGKFVYIFFIVILIATYFAFCGTDSRVIDSGDNFEKYYDLEAVNLDEIQELPYYGLDEDLAKVGVDKIKVIKLDYYDSKYPDVTFKFINENNDEYHGMTFKRDGEDEWELYTLTKGFGEDRHQYVLQDGTREALYDYKTDKMIQEAGSEYKYKSANLTNGFSIQPGENGSYAYWDGTQYLYKLPEGSYFVTRKTVTYDGIDVSYIWVDYDEVTYEEGDYKEYKNKFKYEFSSEDSSTFITVNENTHVDLTEGDFVYTFYKQ